MGGGWLWLNFVGTWFLALNAVKTGWQAFIALERSKKGCSVSKKETMKRADEQTSTRKQTYLDSQVLTRVAAIAGFCVGAPNAFLLGFRHDEDDEVRPFNYWFTSAVE